MTISETKANNCMDTICKTICTMIGHTLEEVNVKEEDYERIVADLYPFILEETRECFVTVCKAINIDAVTSFVKASDLF